MWWKKRQISINQGNYEFLSIDDSINRVLLGGGSLKKRADSTHA